MTRGQQVQKALVGVDHQLVKTGEEGQKIAKKDGIHFELAARPQRQRAATWQGLINRVRRQVPRCYASRVLQNAEAHHRALLTSSSPRPRPLAGRAIPHGGWILSHAASLRLLAGRTVGAREAVEAQHGKDSTPTFVAGNVATHRQEMKRDISRTSNRTKKRGVVRKATPYCVYIYI